MKEKQCARCKEDWPADEEFYYRLKDGRLHSYCRACVTERCRELRAGAVRKIARQSHRLPWFLAMPLEIADRPPLTAA
jgi:hypothetical protein